MNPFDFLNSVNFNKQDLMEGNDEIEKAYNAFLINRGLSYFLDTIFYANDMNMRSHAPNRWQYQYLLHAVPKRNRFSKWAKKDPLFDSDSFQAVSRFFGYNPRRTAETLRIINTDTIVAIRKKMKHHEDV